MPINQLVMMKLLSTRRLRAGPARDPDPRDLVRWHRAPHRRGHAFISSAPRRRASSRRSGSATSPSATPGSRASGSTNRVPAVPRGPIPEVTPGIDPRADGRASSPAGSAIDPLEIERRAGRPAGSSSTSATCTPAATSTAAPGSRSPTASPPGGPSATSRPGYDFTTIEMKLNVFAGGGPGRRADRHRRAASHRRAAPRSGRCGSTAASARSALFTVTQFVIAPPGLSDGAERRRPPAQHRAADHRPAARPAHWPTEPGGWRN